MTTVNCVTFLPEEARQLINADEDVIRAVEAKVASRLTRPGAAKVFWTMYYPDHGGAVRYWEPGTDVPDYVTNICCIAYLAEERAPATAVLGRPPRMNYAEIA